MMSQDREAEASLLAWMESPEALLKSLEASSYLEALEPFRHWSFLSHLLALMAQVALVGVLQEHLVAAEVAPC